MNKMFHTQNSVIAGAPDDSAVSKITHGQVAQDDQYTDVISPPYEDDIREMIPRKIQHNVFPGDSFEVLRKYESRRLKVGGKSSTTSYVMQSAPTSSTEKTIRMAAEKFIQSITENPTCSLAYSGENSEGVELIQSLLSCAEKVGDNQYERALKFLKECDKKDLGTGTPVQRLVFYFSRALFEKIANETGRIIPKALEEKDVHVDPVESVLFPNMNLLVSFHKEHPLSQVTKFVGVEAILDHLKEARKVHVVDLQIRSGVQWIILMQALATRTKHPIQRLKITAVGTGWRSVMEETGRQLAGFAQSLNLDFTFKVVLVEDLFHLSHTLFDLDDDESLAVYAAYSLATFVGTVNQLDHLMRVMKKMNPCVMIVTELEVNCNSPTFIGRFVESLFFFGAFFDSLEDCFKNDETSRVQAEATWFGSAIRNILAADGGQRKFRHVNINVWRAFFTRMGLVEMELSVSSLDQACLGLQSLPHGSSCTLYRDGKCLTLGWKGTPLTSLSAWKFQ